MSKKRLTPQQLVVMGISIEELKTAIIKKFGDGAVFTFTDRPLEIRAIPTGSLSLDKATGIGGWPVGRIIELYGQESGGKSTIALASAAQAQKAGYLAVYVDVEHSLDPAWGARQGVDLANLLLSQPDTAEQALDVVDAVVKFGEKAFIVVDSVAALLPEKEDEEDYSHNTIALQARLMSQAMRKLKGFVSKNECVLLFVNQIREKPGILYGNPETTPGGRALKFYASLRVEVKKGEVYKDGKVMTGHQVKCRVVKNKVAAPYKACEFDILYDRGIDRVKEIVTLAEAAGLVQRRGAWYKYVDTSGKEYSWQGLAAARQEVDTLPSLFEELEAALRQAFPVLNQKEVNGFD